MRHPDARIGLVTLAAVAIAVLAPLTADAAPAAEGRTVGDTLTVVMRPILSVPEIVADGHGFTIEAKASTGTSGWSAALERDDLSYPLALSGVSYESAYERWFMTATVPTGTPEELYDLHVQASGGIDDVTKHSVMVEDAISNDFYFVHITDTHLPTHLFYYENGAETDTTEMDDLRAVIDDINIINPAFVLLTGDVVNEGELEDYLDRHYFTKAKRILGEFDVPVFVTAGNHDVGGWDDTPPPDGTARKTWWRFFGWRYLNDPPPAETIYTQNYSFDYGAAHFTGIEAYNNYDRWRRTTYGNDSFTTRQLAWLADDLSLVHPVKAVVLFYHMDFQDQLNLGSLGVDGTLWGHIHSSQGAEGATPFDLATDSVCDGHRAMRLVRVEDNIVTPSSPISAGSSGYNLRVNYSAPNDGTETEITATITNGQHESFEHGRVKFHVPAASMPYVVDGGTVTHSVVDGDAATYYVNVSIPSMSVTDVTISADTGVGDIPVAALTLTAPATPNPTTSSASVGFSLGAASHVVADVFDLRGRLVAHVLDEDMEPGDQSLTWDTKDAGGRNVPAGVYFVRLASGDRSLSEKLVVLR
jgi:3',5'-cyclic AMP phosphodiesterase CpdA